MSTFKVSKYLQTQSSSNNNILYHSLFGQLCFVDHEGMEFLNLLKTPTTVEEIRNIYLGDYAKIDNFIDGLVKRYFIVPDGYDEYEIIERSMENRQKRLDSGIFIRALQLVMSNNCNFNCKYCFVDHMYDSPERDEFQKSPENKQMSFEVAKQAVEKLLDLLRKNKHKVLTIEFFGGEPLLNWPVIEQILDTFGNGQEGDVGIVYSITTNGSLITEEMAKKFKKYRVTVTISFDSPNNTERGGVNYLETIKKNLQILREYGNWITFNSVMSKETIKDFDGRALVDFAINYNIGMIGLILDLDLKFYENEENKRELLTKMWDTWLYAKDHRMPIVGYWHQTFQQIIGRQALNLFSGYKSCPATGCKLSVEPAGHVFICKCCSGYLGDLSDLDAVITSDKYREYSLKAYRNAEECAGCEIEGFCAGVCMGSREYKYHSLDKIEKSSCEVFKEINRRLIQDLAPENAPRLFLADCR